MINVNFKEEFGEHLDQQFAIPGTIVSFILQPLLIALPLVQVTVIIINYYCLLKF